MMSSVWWVGPSDKVTSTNGRAQLKIQDADLARFIPRRLYRGLCLGDGSSTPAANIGDEVITPTGLVFEGSINVSCFVFS